MLSALTAIAVFPILTLLLFGLARVENDLMETASRASHRRPAEPPTGTAARPAEAEPAGETVPSTVTEAAMGETEVGETKVVEPVVSRLPAGPPLPVLPQLPVVAELPAE